MTAAVSDPGQLLTFELSGQEYAVPLLRVQEIVEYEPVMRVPTAPPFLLGVFDLRGSVLPVIDLATKLGLGATPLTRRSCIVVVELEVSAQLALFGLLVDAVRDVLTTSEAVPSGIEHDDGTFDRPWRELERTDSKVVRLLDLDRLMADSESAAAAEPPSRVYNEMDLGPGELRGSDAAPEGR